MSTATGDQVAAAPDGSGRSVELAIGGMTCASCAARVEKKLNKLDGVTATVNFATETARVSFPARVSPDELIAAVEQAGYTAALPAPAQPAGAEPAGGPQPAGEPDEAAVAAAAAAGVAGAGRPGGGAGDGPGGAVPELAVGLAGAGLAGGGVGGVAVPPRRVRQRPARRRHHGHADLGRGRRPPTCGRCTRCSSATRAGPGAHMSFALLARGAGAGDIYLEVAVRGDGADPAGPLFRGPREAPGGRGAAGAAVAGRQGRRGAARRPRGADPGGAAARWATCSWSGRGRRSPPTASWSPAVRRWTPRC